MRDHSGIRLRGVILWTVVIVILLGAEETTRYPASGSRMASKARLPEYGVARQSKNRNKSATLKSIKHIIFPKTQDLSKQQDETIERLWYIEFISNSL